MKYEEDDQQPLISQPYPEIPLLVNIFPAPLCAVNSTLVVIHGKQDMLSSNRT